MNTTRLLCTLLLAVLFASLPLRAEAAPQATLQAILITASNERNGRSDPRLAPYEGTLRRVLRFESFTFQGSDSGRVRAGNATELVVGQGHELTVQASGENAFTLRIRWADKVGGRTVMETGVTLRPGVPMVIGGMPTERAPGEVYAIILVAR
jgi:hypothetical protein